MLHRFVSDHRAGLAQVGDGVAAADLASDELDYRRGRDKTDKSLEIYKFYINALYAELARAIRNVYLIESDTGHPLRWSVLFIRRRAFRTISCKGGWRKSL